jgi:N-acetyltransferase
MEPMWDTNPRIIVGGKVVLEPLTMSLFDEVCNSVLPDPDGWYSQMFGLTTPDAYRVIFENSEKYIRNKTGMGFAIRDRDSQTIAGFSFFLNMNEENRHLEIGSTNIAPRFRRTHINTAAKLTMLQEAFERMNCIRVSFRIDEENHISRKAVERIGSKLGGVLRNERILPGGRIRNYCFYCIIDSEWPEVKARLTKLSSNSLKGGGSQCINPTFLMREIRT